MNLFGSFWIFKWIFLDCLNLFGSFLDRYGYGKDPTRITMMIDVTTFSTNHKGQGEGLGNLCAKDPNRNRYRNRTPDPDLDHDPEPEPDPNPITLSPYHPNHYPTTLTLTLTRTPES